MSTDDDDPDERLMEWALHERLGGERPPDLLAAVRARLHAGTAPARREGRSRLFAAAALLVGTAVVCGVALWPKRGPEPAVPLPAQQPHARPAAQVHSLADVAALPAGTREVEATDVGDDVIEALTRLRDLEVLVVREPSNESFGMSLKMQPPANPQHVTAASWPQFAKLTKLRRLELSGTAMACQLGDDRTAEALAGLERLPLLEHVSLRFLDSPGAVLKRLPALRNLRSLDLSFNHAFGESGFQALLQCRSLRTLSLRGCQQVNGSWIARLHELPELEELDLSAIDGINWRAGPTFFDDGQDGKLIRQAGLALGPNDAALAGLAKCPKLRVLDVGGGHWTNAGLAQLGGCATLRELNAFGGGGNGDPAFVAWLPSALERLEVCGDYTDAFCAAVREHLPKLRHVCVAACYKITDAGIAELCGIPSLRVLDMRQMRGLTIASVDHLMRAAQLEELDVRHCDFVTAQHVVRLRRALPKLAKIHSNFTDEQIAGADTLPDPVQVRTKEEIYALPADTRNVLATDIDDHCMPYFKRLRALERLEITAEWASPGQRKVVPEVRSITDDGLRQLAGLPALRILKLGGELEVVGPGLDVLGALPSLEEVTIRQMKVGDMGLANLTKASRLRTLSVQYAQGFTAQTFTVIQGMTSLRGVSLQGCVHVEDTWLAQIAALPNLEDLDLSMIGSRTFFSGWGGPLPPAEPGSGVTDRVLEALGNATKLRHLYLSHAGISGNGLRQMQGLPQLEYLCLDGTSLTASDLKQLPPGITYVSLQNCAELGQDFGLALAASTPRLRYLDLESCPKLTDACLKGLRELRSLRYLDLSHCRGFTADAIDDLVALEFLEKLSMHEWRAFGESEWARVRAMPNLKRLDTDQGSETLRR